MDCVQPQTPADAEAEKNMKQLFRKIAGDDLEVDPWELQHILNTVYKKGMDTRHIILVVQRFGVGLLIERSLVRLPAGALSSQLGQLSLPSLQIEYQPPWLGLGGARSLVSGGR